jgi:hypothetical protein
MPAASSAARLAPREPSFPATTLLGGHASSPPRTTSTGQRAWWTRPSETLPTTRRPTGPRPRLPITRTSKIELRMLLSKIDQVLATRCPTRLELRVTNRALRGLHRLGNPAFSRGAFSARGCPLLHLIALPMVSGWCRYGPSHSPRIEVFMHRPTCCGRAWCDWLTVQDHHQRCGPLRAKPSKWTSQ